jgi:uracil-DNA glycosylase family 4
VQCPRLVAYRHRVAQVKVRRYRDWEYWSKPVPGFGKAKARLLIIGLAPAAHGGNRTGRVFTGDRSGDFLYEALYASGFASQPTSTHRGDSLKLYDCYITAAVRCAPPDNKPLPEEFAACQPYLLAELALLRRVRVVVALGQIAFAAYLKARRASGLRVPTPLPRFGHGVAYTLDGGGPPRGGPPRGVVLIGSYHPSQQNTFTGRLTKEMFHAIFQAARTCLEKSR